MILWRTNFNLDEDILRGVIDKVNGNPDRLGKVGMYTTYFTKSVQDREEIIFAPHYRQAIGDGLSALGMQHRTGYTFDHWMQVYGEGNVGHTPHDHYTHQTLLSWVHFVCPTTPAFHFIDSDHNKTYPEQNRGDFIMFSPWMLHGVDASDDLRAVIAGNVYITDLISPCDESINLYYTFEKGKAICNEISAVL